MVRRDKHDGNSKGSLIAGAARALAAGDALGAIQKFQIDQLTSIFMNKSIRPDQAAEPLLLTPKGCTVWSLDKRRGSSRATFAQSTY
jgi:hypothetical protein